MRVLVIGDGAREDALSWRLAQSPSCDAVFAAPGNAGTESRGENWSDLTATDGKALTARACEHGIDLVVIGPETAIAAGVADRLRGAGLQVFGPDRSAGRLETSKIFAKRFMQKHGIPTARAQVVHSLDAARKALDAWRGGVVVKADGLAAGKGVVVCDTPTEALEVLAHWYGPQRVPGGGTGVLLEQRLVGRELSAFAFCDGTSIVAFGSACDYKRAGDGDTGPNTGGMGAYTPAQGLPADAGESVRTRIFEPVLRGLLADGERYVGALYCGLMWTDDGPVVIEFNARFGDPETQAMMPLVEGDFAALLASVASGAVDPNLAHVGDGACVAVVLATTEYPRTSTPLGGLQATIDLGAGVQLFWSASKLQGDTIRASGGRVLTVSARGSDVADARERVYSEVRSLAAKLGRNELTFRSDIAKR